MQGVTVGVRAAVIVRKQGVDPSVPSPRKILIDFLKTSAIIADNFTGTLVLHFNQGGITGSEKVEKGII